MIFLLLLSFLSITSLILIQTAADRPLLAQSPQTNSPQPQSGIASQSGRGASVVSFLFPNSTVIILCDTSTVRSCVSLLKSFLHSRVVSLLRPNPDVSDISPGILFLSTVYIHTFHTHTCIPNLLNAIHKYFRNVWVKVERILKISIDRLPYFLDPDFSKRVRHVFAMH